MSQSRESQEDVRKDIGRGARPNSPGTRGDQITRRSHSQFYQDQVLVKNYLFLSLAIIHTAHTSLR